MMKEKLKRNVLIFIGIIIIAILLVFGFKDYSKMKNKVSKPNKFITNIIKKIDNKEKFILYLNDDPNICGSACSDIYDIVSFYEEVYNLKFIEVNKSKIPTIDYNKLLKKLNCKESDITYPNVVMIEEGYAKERVNSVVTEELFKNALIDNGYISADSISNDVQIDYNTFWEYYKGVDDKLVLFYTYENPDSYKFRGKVLRLSRSYNFNYSVVYFGLASSSLIADELDPKIDGGFAIPSLMIVSNSGVKDSVSLNDDAKIEEFLRKNNVITE